jgi:nucleotide-binding universal stress UspA family protein
MINLKRILCPVDLSESSLLALRFANAVAGRYKSSLTVIHVLQNPHADIPGGETGAFSFGELIGLYKEERQEEILAILRQKGSHATGYEVIFEEGVPYNKITEIAKKIKADMIIMSSNTSGSHGMLIGHTTERTVRLAPCPVLSVQTNYDEKSKEDIEKLDDLMDTSPNAKRTILLPTDFSEHSMLANRYAISLAKEYKAELIVLHVIESVAELSLTSGIDLPSYNTASIYYDELLKTAQRRIKDICKEAIEHGVNVSDRIIYGNPKHEILDLADSEQLDMIIMGTHGRKGFSRFINGSVAEAVVRHAPCSVLSVKYPEHDFIDADKTT